MKIFVDFLPLIAFFVTFKLKGIFAAALALMVATLFQMAYLRHIKARISKLQIFGLVLVLILGAGTLIFHDQRFLFWKATMVDLVFAGTFLVSLFFGKKSATQLVYEESFEEGAANVSSAMWRRLSWQWVIFFLCEAALNLVVAFHCSLTVWVDFKTFGMPLMMFAMMLLQGLQLRPVLSETPP